MLSVYPESPRFTGSSEPERVAVSATPAVFTTVMLFGVQYELTSVIAGIVSGVAGELLAMVLG